MRRCHFCKKLIWPWQYADKLGLGHDDCTQQEADSAYLAYLYKKGYMRDWYNSPPDNITIPTRIKRGYNE